MNGCECEGCWRGRDFGLEDEAGLLGAGGDAALLRQYASAAPTPECADEFSQIGSAFQCIRCTQC